MLERKRLFDGAKIACLALAAEGLGGCGHVETHYAPIACITQAQMDQLRAQEPPKVREQLNGQADHDLKIIAANDVRFRAYADGLLTVLGGCVEKK